MLKIARTRRDLFRLLASSAAISLGSEAASAQPPGRGKPVLRAKPPPGYRPMVVIDPGHGGIDPGAIGASGVYEKDIVFATSTDLVQRLRATRRFRVALTREADEFVPLRERVARARALRADLFMSVHADALPNAAMRGLSVFTLSAKASDREAAALAASQNQETVDGIQISREPAEVEEILIDLARRHTDNRSVALAHNVVTTLGRQVVLLDNPQRSAAFAVLTAPDIPSTLVETGCLSNTREEFLLQQPAYRQRLARGLANAIEAYFAVPRDG